jgi:hypothetical protein
MANFNAQIGRKTIYFSDHSLDRWWERCQENGLHGRQQAMDLLRSRLAEASWMGRAMPVWTRLSRWHRARAEGFLALDDESGFVVNRNIGGDFVAVTYIERAEQVAA